MRVSRIYRILRLVTILQGNRSYSADELARELEVSRRTVFRDLNMLEMARIPYYFDPDRKGYHISRHFFLPPVNLTLGEALAMLMLAGRMRGTGKLPLLSQGAKAAVKLESALPESIRKHVGSVIGHLNVSLGPMSRHEGLDADFELLADAIAQKRICQLVYISFHEKKQITTTVEPLRLTFNARAWYLIAYSVKHRQLRTFKLGRIRKLTVTEQTFQDRDDVDDAQSFGQAWQMIPEGKLYDVQLHFGPKVAGNVAEVQWHASQKVQWNDDGSIEYTVTVDGLGEITWWILGYGDHVEVISPPSLRKRLAEIARNIVGKYGKERPRS